MSPQEKEVFRIVLDTFGEKMNQRLTPLEKWMEQTKGGSKVAGIVCLAALTLYTTGHLSF